MKRMIPDFALKDKSCATTSTGVPSSEGLHDQHVPRLSPLPQLPAKVAELLMVSTDMWDADLVKPKKKIFTKGHQMRVFASMGPLARQEDEAQQRDVGVQRISRSAPTRLCLSENGQAGIASAESTISRPPMASITRLEADSLFLNIFVNEQSPGDMTCTDKTNKPSSKDVSKTAKSKACEHLQRDNQKPAMEYSCAKSASSSNEGNKKSNPRFPGGGDFQKEQLCSALIPFGHSEMYDEEDDDSVIEDDADDDAEIVIGPTKHAFGGHNPEEMWFASPNGDKVHVRSSASVLFFSDIQRLTKVRGCGQPASFGSMLHLCSQECRPCMFERVPGRCRKLWLCDFCHLHMTRKHKKPATSAAK